MWKDNLLLCLPVMVICVIVFVTASQNPSVDSKQEQERKQLELIAKQQEIIGVIIDRLEEQDKRIKKLEDKR